MKFLEFSVLIATVLFVGSASADEYHPHVALTSADAKSAQHLKELDSDYWREQAQAAILSKIEQHVFGVRRKPAKNIILFLGDGMSVHTVTATRAFLGDASHQHHFEQFPYYGLSKTYCVDKQVPDSACTSTAYLSGIKGNYGTIGVNAQVTRGDCERGQQQELHTASLAQWAQAAGKWAGLVTTARVTHASPAGVYAHVADREWEYDTKITEAGCEAGEANVDIARQLIEWPVGRELRVVMGGGRRSFLNETVLDEDGEPLGKRSDGRDLIAEWLTQKQAQGARATYAANKQQLLQTNLQQNEYLLGLFADSHCPYHGDLEREQLVEEVPSLSEMTAAAIEMLSQHEQGYFLFVEGAKIDMAHHDTRARRALEDTAEFARAVELASAVTDAEETLIVVTSDHAHTMTINGYPSRDADILGLNAQLAADDLPYTILSYANGPGYEKTYSAKKGRKDLSDKDFTNPKRKYMATVPLESETHGGDDVGVYANGPWAHLFSGSYEQTNIPMLMAKAANIGPYQSN